MAKKKLKDVSETFKKQIQAINNCKLCSRFKENGINNRFGCCRRCRSVRVKLKDIKPAISDIKYMLKKHKKQKQRDIRYQQESKVVTDVQVEDAFAEANSDEGECRRINLASNCYMRINVPCAYYPHDIHTTSPKVLHKYFGVELSILFKLGHSSHSADSVMCTACGVIFVTDGKSIAQKTLETHVSEIHVPNSTARDYRFVCIICDGTVYDLLGVKKHMAEKHSSLMTKEECGDHETHVCQICKQLLKGKSRLNSEKPQLFANKAELQMHIDIAHPGNFTCAECKNSLVFKTLEMLNMHMSAYHPEVG